MAVSWVFRFLNIILQTVLLRIFLHIKLIIVVCGTVPKYGLNVVDFNTDFTL